MMKAEVDLLNSKLPYQVIAQGTIISKDPSKVVGGMQLGRDFWEVYVEKAVKPNELLVRPWEGVNIVGEAVKKTVAWQSLYVFRFITIYIF